MSRGVSFTTHTYDEEVARIAGDHPRETAERTAGRRVLTQLNGEALAAHSLVSLGGQELSKS